MVHKSSIKDCKFEGASASTILIGSTEPSEQSRLEQEVIRAAKEWRTQEDSALWPHDYDLVMAQKTFRASIDALVEFENQK